MQFDLSTPQGMWIIVGGALVAAILYVVIRNLVIRERKHLNDLAGALNDFGLPATYTTPIADLAVGDKAGAIGALLKAVEQLKTPTGFGDAVASVVAKALTDPTRKAALMKALADVQAGAPAPQISADVQGMLAADPLMAVLGHGPIATDLSHVVTRLQAIKANPALAQFLPALSGLPQQFQSIAAQIFDAGHSIGQQAAASSTAPPAPGPSTPAPSPAPAPMPGQTA